MASYHRRPTSSGVIHAIVSCDNCEWSTGSYKNALALAAQHHDRTGHVVRCEIGTYVVYGETPPAATNTPEGEGS